MRFLKLRFPSQCIITAWHHLIILHKYSPDCNYRLNRVADELKDWIYFVITSVSILVIWGHTWVDIASFSFLQLQKSRKSGVYLIRSTTLLLYITCFLSLFNHVKLIGKISQVINFGQRQMKQKSNNKKIESLYITNFLPLYLLVYLEFSYLPCYLFSTSV